MGWDDQEECHQRTHGLAGSLGKLTVGLERPGWHDNRGGSVIDFEKRRTCWYVVSLCAALRHQPNCVCDPLAERWPLLECVGSVLVDD